jgi:hypothetical protein
MPSFFFIDLQSVTFVCRNIILMIVYLKLRPYINILNTYTHDYLVESKHL